MVSRRWGKHPGPVGIVVLKMLAEMGCRAFPLLPLLEVCCWVTTKEGFSCHVATISVNLIAGPGALIRGKQLWGSYSVPFLHMWTQGAGQCWHVWFYMYMGGVPVAVTVANRKGRSSQAVATLKLQLTDAGVCVTAVCVCFTAAL